MLSSLAKLSNQVEEEISRFDERWHAEVVRLRPDQLRLAFEERDRIEVKYAAWRRAYNAEVKLILERGYRNASRAPETRAAFDEVMAALRDYLARGAEA